MHRTSSLFVGALALATCVTLGGCSLALSPLSKRSAAFGNAASVVIRDSSKAYDSVERVSYNAGVSSLVLDFDKSGFDRNKIKPFLPAKDLQVRQNILRGLRKYADTLAEVAGEKSFTSLDKQATELSGVLDEYAAFQNSFAGRPPSAPMTSTKAVTGRYQVIIGAGDHGAGLDSALELADSATSFNWFLTVKPFGGCTSTSWAFG